VALNFRRFTNNWMQKHKKKSTNFGNKSPHQIASTIWHG
jgi:hypothetical protein